MVDPAFLRDSASVVRAALQSRGVDLTAELEELAALESARRRLLPDIEGLKRDQNKAGEEAARARRDGLDISRIQETSRARAQQIKQMGAELESIEARRHRARTPSPRKRTRTWVPRLASLISNAAPRSQAPASRCLSAPARDSRAG